MQDPLCRCAPPAPEVIMAMSLRLPCRLLLTVLFMLLLSLV